jgi:hypothetical protein
LQIVSGLEQTINNEFISFSQVEPGIAKSFIDGNQLILQFLQCLDVVPVFNEFLIYSRLFGLFMLQEPVVTLL